MEVHHHPHVEKKSFKEYLLEGLMIFLAVTMGFFAESLRESINTSTKEKEYITSFYHDLQKDKAGLDDIIVENQKKVAGLDSLLMLAHSNLADPKNRESIYHYSWAISNYSVFISNDATMTQLKNSGGLQFIKEKDIADSVAKYDEEVRGIYAAQTSYERFSGDATEAMTQFLIFNLNDEERKTGDNKSFPFVTNAPQQAQIFFNKVKLERGWSQNYINNLQERLPYTNRLIQLLKDRYSLDGE